VDSCKDLIKELFKLWTEDATNALSEGRLALLPTGPVVQIDDDRKLHVNYPWCGINVLHEIGLLQTEGCSVPAEVVKALMEADKFPSTTKLAAKLMQCLDVYNSIGRQMLEFQKPMLIEPAKAFEAVAFEAVAFDAVAQKTGISSKQDASLTWDNVAALEAYIGKLQTAASDLTVRDRRLRLARKSLMEKPVALFSIDLVAKREQWKQALRDMRVIVEELQRAGYVGMKAWTTHIDKQIFKALEHQYALGMEALSENLPGSLSSSTRNYSSSPHSRKFERSTTAR
jgi:dynein heavy chain 2